MIIYKLTSPSGKVYIGQTTRDLETRVREHYGKKDKEKTSAISYAFRKYPNLDEWDISVIQHCSSAEELSEAEIYWISYYNSFGNGYNMNAGGDIITSGPMKEEHKQNISEARKKFWETEKGHEWKEVLSKRMSEENICKPGNIPWNHNVKNCFTEESRKQMSESQRKRYEDPEESKKASERIKKLWERGVFDNRPLPTPEAVQKRIKTLKEKGFKQTDYQKQRAREANLGKVLSEETKRKISEKAKNRVMKRVECPHCGKVGAGGRMLGAHFDNCKKKPK